MAVRSRGWWISALLAVGCAPTQLVVVVDSDLDLAEVEAEASAGASPVTETFDLASVSFPFSFGVTRSSGAGDDVLVAVSGIDAAGARVVERRVRTRFLDGHTLRIEIPLSRSCVGEPTCADLDRDSTCVFGECVPAEVDPHTLPTGVGGDPPASLFDGATEYPDAGVAPVDAGAACVEGEACDTGEACERGERRCEASPTCVAVETLPVGSPCGSGRTCSAEGTCASQP